MNRMLAVITCLAAFAVVGCDETEEAITDLRAEEACDDYCDKKFSCAEDDPTSEEDEACENDCVTSLEDTCGENDRQGAIEKLNECVEEEECGDFTACLIFEAAPECFDFTD